MTTTTFTTGTRYSTCPGADYVWEFTVTARTAKFITIKDDRDSTSRVGVFVSDGVERCLPLGRYSMAPVMSATTIVED